MRVTAINTQTKRKRQDKSVHRAEKHGRMTKVTRISGPIRTHRSGLMRAARRPPCATLDRQTKSGDLAIRR